MIETMRYYTYDNKEDINKCLNCTKKECNNCLGNFSQQMKQMNMMMKRRKTSNEKFFNRYDSKRIKRCIISDSIIF